MLLVNGSFLITIEGAGFLYAEMDAHSLCLSVNKPPSVWPERLRVVTENAPRLLLGLEEALATVSSVWLLFLNADRRVFASSVLVAIVVREQHCALG